MEINEKIRFLIASGALHCLRVNKVGTKKSVKWSQVIMFCINMIAGDILQEEKMVLWDSNGHTKKESKKKSQSVSHLSKPIK